MCARLVARWVLALVAWASPWLASAQMAKVGDVVMAVGDVTRVIGGRGVAIRTGDAIHEGDEITAGSDGYVYVRAVDAGFFSLRPNSSVRFEIYRYDPVDPSLSHVRVSLTRGVARSVSGRAAAGARHNYRLNTPVAAIGLRGTDFTVFANAELTRVTVRSGGVVLAPFGPECAQVGFGPCAGTASRELMADRPDTLIQLRLGDPVPTVLETSRQPMVPDRIAPPLPDENSAAAVARARNGNGVSNGAVASQQPVADPAAKPPLQEIPATVAAALPVLHEGQIAEALTTASVVTPPQVAPPQVTPPQVTPPALPPAPSITAIEWGRWRSVAGTGPATAIDAILAGGRKLEALNSMFGIARDPASLAPLPTAGVYSFQLTAHEGYLFNHKTELATPATVSNAMFQVDFNASRFSTSLDLAAGSATARLSAQGTVYPTGEFVRDLLSSNGTVSGVLAGPSGTQAGYIYQRPLDSARNFVGATSWRR